jgi:hypothetical protein
MLAEIRHVKQERGKDRRRWFTDDYWDLYVWVNAAGEFSGFQLCYGKPDAERALTWMEGQSPAHTGVSEASPGRAGAMNLEASILVADGTMDVRTVARRFWQESKGIDKTVRIYVVLKLKELMKSGHLPV